MPAPPTVGRSSSCTAGRTTYTSTSMSPLGSWQQVTACSFRTCAGYGTTRFLSEQTFRNGEQAALAVDTIAFLDALGIDRAIVAGFDWGARTAGVVAALWPERVDGLVSVSGYLIGSQEAGKLPLPP